MKIPRLSLSLAVLLALAAAGLQPLAAEPVQHTWQPNGDHNPDAPTP